MLLEMLVLLKEVVVFSLQSLQLFLKLGKFILQQLLALICLVSEHFELLLHLLVTAAHKKIADEFAEIQVEKNAGSHLK